MSALGQKRTLCSANSHVRFTPESGHSAVRLQCPLRAHLIGPPQSLIRDGELLLLASRLRIEQRGARKG